LKRILFAIITIAFAACSSEPSVDETRDSITQTMDSQRIAVKDSVTMKSDTNEKRIDSSFKVLQDSIQRVK